MENDDDAVKEPYKLKVEEMKRELSDHHSEYQRQRRSPKEKQRRMPKRKHAQSKQTATANIAETLSIDGHSSPNALSCSDNL